MPLVRIDVIRGRSAEQKKALLAAVHDALVEGLHVPDWDRTQRLHELAPEDFERPPGKSDTYTLVEISMFPGRSLDAKRRLYQAIVRNLGQLGTAPSDVFIVLHEPPMENWGVRGGIPASEIDLGFEIRV
jgi:phenylpyruvate tautomerase PptA (4-oxalocrotonate tautomerase family)